MTASILIVDDEVEILNLLKQELPDYFPACRIECYQSGREALKRLEQKSFDMVISDMGLRDQWVGGGDVLKRAQEQGCFLVSFSGMSRFRPSHIALPKPYSQRDLAILKAKYNSDWSKDLLEARRTLRVSRLSPRPVIAESLIRLIDALTHC